MARSGPSPGALAMAEAAARAGCGARSPSRRANAPEAALAGGARGRSRWSGSTQLALLGGEGEPPPAAPPSLTGRERRAERRARGPRRPAGPAVPAVRARGGGRRRSQHADRRPARRRQVARRAAPAVDHARALDRSEAMEVLRIASACGRPAPRCARDAAVQGASPHDLHRRAGGRRLAPPRRARSRSPTRGAVPGRARRVLVARRSRRCASRSRRAG